MRFAGQQVEEHAWPAVNEREDLCNQIAIEMVGRAGHPSSYGLLGAVWKASMDSSQLLVRIHVSDFEQASRYPYPEALASRLDRCYVGLPAEYIGGVVEAFAASFRSERFFRAGQIEVCSAVCGEVGSSPRVFQWLMTALLTVLAMPAEHRTAELLSQSAQGWFRERAE